MSVVELGDDLMVVYAPRPTLSGILVEGVLTELYQQRHNSFSVTAEAMLQVTDVSGVTNTVVQCAEPLPRTQ